MKNFTPNRSRPQSYSHDRGSEGPQMHKAVCSKCGKSCLVPFKPTGNRPIFCADCFKTEGAQSMRRSDDRGSERTGERKMYDAVCDTCGNRCQIPFAPRADKPVYCSHCFEQREKEGKGFRERPQGFDEEKLAALHNKLDTIISLLNELKIAPQVSNTVTEVADEIVAAPVTVKTARRTTVKKKTVKKKKS